MPNRPDSFKVSAVSCVAAAVISSVTAFLVQLKLLYVATDERNKTFFDELDDVSNDVSGNDCVRYCVSYVSKDMGDCCDLECGNKGKCSQFRLPALRDGPDVASDDAIARLRELQTQIETEEGIIDEKNQRSECA